VGEDPDDKAKVADSIRELGSHQDFLAVRHRM